MAKFKPEVLTKALLAAKAAAEAEKHAEDGGTCNFDSAVVQVPRVRAATIEAAAAAAGVGLCSFTWHGSRAYWVQLGQGQASRRTRMAEAARKAMQAFEAEGGFETSMYYQMD